MGAFAEAAHFLLNGILDDLEAGTLFGDGGPVFTIAVGGFGDLRFSGRFLGAERLKKGEGVLGVGAGVRIAAQAGDDFGVTALDGAPDGLAHDAAGFGGGERGIERIEAGEDDVVSVVVAVSARGTVKGSGAGIQRFSLLFEAGELSGKPGSRLRGGGRAGMESVVGERLDEGINHGSGAGGVRIGISDGNETRAGIGSDFAMMGEDFERDIAAVGSVGKRGREGLEGLAPEEQLVERGEGARVGREVIGRGLEAGAADHVEGDGVGLKNADFGLEREVVVEGVADGGGLFIADCSVETVGAVGLLLDLDEGHGAIAWGGPGPVEDRDPGTEGEGGEYPGAAASEDVEEVDHGPFDRRIAVRMARQRSGGCVHGRTLRLAGEAGSSAAHSHALALRPG